MSGFRIVLRTSMRISTSIFDDYLQAFASNLRLIRSQRSFTKMSSFDVRLRPPSFFTCSWLMTLESYGAFWQIFKCSNSSLNSLLLMPSSSLAWRGCIDFFWTAEIVNTFLTSLTMSFSNRLTRKVSLISPACLLATSYSTIYLSAMHTCARSPNCSICI